MDNGKKKYVLVAAGVIASVFFITIHLQTGSAGSSSSEQVGRAVWVLWHGRAMVGNLGLQKNMN